ncbi:MAG: hypothetical protein JWO15_961 [Sphingomonadales bacterium]|nr:hypothetical protein [Sphingomonadales bacterium]
MSIHKMISLHPDVAGDLNEAFATAARHAMYVQKCVVNVLRIVERRYRPSVNVSRAADAPACRCP